METNKQINLSEENFKKEVLESRGPILVEFGADWCGPCHIVAPILKELAQEFEGKVKIYQLDVDRSQKVTTEYGIQSIPTFLFFNQGKLVDHFVGAASKETITQKINALIKSSTKEN